MSINNLVPLTLAMIGQMNDGTRAQGSEGANVVTAGECAVLADELNVAEETARRWFRVADSRGTPPYRRLVPISVPPGNRLGYVAVGRRIARMYPDATMDPAQVQAMESLRYRCYLGAAMGTDGLSRDQTYYGTPFVWTEFLNTLWSCLLTIEEVVSGEFQQDHNSGLFWQRAWVNMAITHRDVSGLPWVLTISAIQPDYQDQYEQLNDRSWGPAKPGKVIVEEDLTDADVDARKAAGNPQP